MFRLAVPADYTEIPVSGDNMFILFVQLPIK